MSINGIGNLPPGLTGPGALSVRPGTTERNRTETAAANAPASTAATRVQAARAGHDALPAEAPPGTDPELWKVLTSDERAHFAKAGARGPLTYGYLARSQPAAGEPVSRGVRLDLKA